MKRTTLLMLAGLSAGFAAHAAEPAARKAPASATASHAGVTVAIDPATGRLRAPTASEQARLRTAVATRAGAAQPMSIAKPGPKTRAEAERTFRRHRDGSFSMMTSDDMMSYATATQREDGSIVIGHGDADGHAAPASTVEVASE